MHTPTDNTTASGSEQGTEPTKPPARNLVSIWAQGRRRFTPWAYPRLRALAVARLVIGIFVAGVGAVLDSRGHYGWAAIPLAGAVLLFSIAYLDNAAARSAGPATDPAIRAG
jgi:hypothetical protein